MSLSDYHLTAARNSGRAASTKRPPRHTYPALTAYVAERRRRTDEDHHRLMAETSDQATGDPHETHRDAESTSETSGDA
jgi:hypothetical protein